MFSGVDSLCCYQCPKQSLPMEYRWQSHHQTPIHRHSIVHHSCFCWRNPDSSKTNDRRCTPLASHHWALVVQSPVLHNANQPCQYQNSKLEWHHLQLFLLYFLMRVFFLSGGRWATAWSSIGGDFSRVSAWNYFAKDEKKWVGIFFCFCISWY